MKLFKIGIIFISFLMILMQGCKKDVSENPISPENTKGTLTEEIGKASGINEVIHSSFFGEVNSNFYWSFSLDLTLQSPEKRNLIKKIMIIDQTNGQGWEFYDNDLPKYYADSLKGYRFPHLIFTNSSSYGQPVYDRFFKIKLYGYDNSTSDDFEFVLKSNSISYPQTIVADWFDKSLLNITSYGSSKIPKEVKIVWLQNGVAIGQSIATNKIIGATSYYTSSMVSTVNNIPDNADSYYLSITDEKIGGSKSLFISSQYLIPNRLPAQAAMLQDGISLDRAIYAKGVNKVIMTNSNARKMYIMNFDNAVIEKTVDLPSTPVSGAMDYSIDSSKVYIGTKSGIVYSYSLNQNKLDLFYNTGSEIYGLVLANKTLMISNYSTLVSIRLDTREVSNTTSYIFSDMVYNRFNNVIYCRSNSSSYYLYRIEINSQTGMASGYSNSTYYGSYPINQPIKIFPDGQKLINSSGTIFSCTVSNSTDMKYLSTIGTDAYSNAYTDLIFSPDNAKFITIFASQNNLGQIDGRLQVFNAQTFIEEKRLPLAGSPKFIFNNNDKLLIISYLSNSGRYFALPLFYSGLIQSGLPAGWNNSGEHFFSKKLNS